MSRARPTVASLPRNPRCPYCSILLVDAENQPNSRSVEHLIPNTVLSIPRKPRDGDFFACRSCNSKKSHIDYVLGVVAKLQSRDEAVATRSLIGAVNSGDGRSKRFKQMAVKAVHTPQGVSTLVPISGKELLEYISFLGRGQYFRKRGRIFDVDKQAMIVDYINKHVLSVVESSYMDTHGTSPFEDLIQNKYAESYSNGECIIYSKNDRFMFMFHRYTAIVIKIKPRNVKNLARSMQSAEELLMHFPFEPTIL